MLSYLSKSPGIGGTIKSTPEDFIVEEIGTDGTVFELDKPISKPDEPGKSLHFILQKKNWSTSSAVSELAARLGISQARFNIAGTKDKLSISTQLVSVSAIPKAPLLSLDIKDISINGAWTAGERVHLGQLLGNRFSIKVKDACEGDVRSRSEAIAAELGKKFPNYFGEQRFGSTRRNTHTIGMKLLQGSLEEAVRMFLCDIGDETHTEARLARKELEENGDYARALKTFPKHLRLERSLIAHLAKRQGDYAGALRTLPRNTLLMFVHAVQSHLFNQLLSDRLSEELELEQGEYFCGETSGFPDPMKTEAEGWIVAKLVGYNTMLNGREAALLEKLNISKDDFRMKALPEINSKGSRRTLLAPMKDFNLNDATFRFSLPSGCYATVAMREFMKGG